MNAPPTVVASEPALRGGQIVLIDQGPGHQLRWITGLVPSGQSGPNYRNYFHTEGDARRDFAERCKRGC